MSIATKNFAPFKQIYKSLRQELLIIQNKSAKVHAERDLEKSKALLTYKKLTLLKQGKDISELDQKLKDLENGVVAESKSLKDGHILLELIKEPKSTPTPYQLNNLNNIVTFLNSQRVYTELLERYNPGLTMTQEDNVRKTANKVGLSVPQ